MKDIILTKDNLIVNNFNHKEMIEVINKSLPMMIETTKNFNKTTISIYGQYAHSKSSHSYKKY